MAGSNIILIEILIGLGLSREFITIFISEKICPRPRISKSMQNSPTMIKVGGRKKASPKVGRREAENSSIMEVNLQIFKMTFLMTR